MIQRKLKNNGKKDYLPKTTIEYLHKVVALSMIANRDLFKNLDRKSKYNLEIWKEKFEDIGLLIKLKKRH